jgi:hypothetical protein
MKKLTYIILFIVCFAANFFYDLYNSSSLLSSGLVSSGAKFFTIIVLILVSLVQSLIPYLTIILIIHTIKCHRGA